jgi:8-oxo-dGTP pyrophosphatase MutT (NUDIX family)
MTSNDDAAMPRGGPQFIPRPPRWRVGDPAAWRADASWADRLGVDDVRRVFRNRPPGRPVDHAHPGGGRSAVAVLLFPDDGRLHLLLTRRAWHLRNHRGEVAFPGGAADPGDVDDAATALREAQEEVALDPTLVEVVGELDHLTTRISDRVIVPVVGVLDRRPELAAADDEVDAILCVPLAELVTDGVHHQEHWDLGGERQMHFFELTGDTIWGATASVVAQLLAVLADGSR